ncbi:hypothetical protein BD769DRAFT_1392256 [Suillus cothurnatus]|nr:hypothetical protein BD769DRAFT_1392244 [Suillus cothurnatus]KAG2110448.1 hypothetical protein BD769DRAFT_1392256 [Suillus cothurnatus]
MTMIGSNGDDLGLSESSSVNSGSGDSDRVFFAREVEGVNTEWSSSLAGGRCLVFEAGEDKGPIFSCWEALRRPQGPRQIRLVGWGKEGVDFFLLGGTSSDAKEEDTMEGSDDEEEDEEGHELEDAEDDEGDETQDLLTTEYLIDDDIADEMDEFGYTGLDQVLVEDEDGDGLLDNALGAEDGEELEGGLNYDEAEEIGFADL